MVWKNFKLYEFQTLWEIKERYFHLVSIPNYNLLYNVRNKKHPMTESSIQTRAVALYPSFMHSLLSVVIERN